MWGFLRSPIGKYALLAILVLYVGWRGYSAIIDRGVAICEARNSKILADKQKQDAKALAASIKRAQEQAREIALQDAEVLQDGITYRTKLRDVYRDREVEIVKLVPPDCSACRLGTDGIKLLNDALSNATTTPTNPGSEPNPVPKSSVPDNGGDTTRGFRNLDSRGRQIL
jgi:hypothetical protein